MKTLKFLGWLFIALTYGLSVIWALIFFVALALSFLLGLSSDIKISLLLLFLLAMAGTASLDMEPDGIMLRAPAPKSIKRKSKK